MRGRYDFPPRPTSKEDIYGSACPPWLMACSLVGKFDRWQVNTYRKLYRSVNDDGFFRDVLDATRIILKESRNIIALRAQALAAGQKLGRASLLPSPRLQRGF